MAKIPFSEIQEFRANGTIQMIEEELRDIDINDIITDIFVTTDDIISKQLIKKFESQLILSKINPKKFKSGLLTFFKQTTKFIEDNKLHKKFFEFCYFIYNSLNDKNINKHIINAYQDLLIEQYSHLGKPQEFMCGISSENKPYYASELYPFLEYPLSEYQKKYGVDANPRWNKIMSLTRKYGYDINSLDELLLYLRDDQIIGNMFYQMSYFINETTDDIIPKPQYLPSEGIAKIREYLITEKYLELLQQRKYLLPYNGVVGKYTNTGNIKEILFKERFIYDDLTPVLLFKIKFDNNCETMGYYDSKLNSIYTYWKESYGGKHFHKVLENFILENYWHLVCDVEIKTNRAIALKKMNDKDNFLYSEQPGVEYVVLKRDKIGKVITKTYNREDYKAVWTDIHPFVRKLPMGSTASSEAKKLAREMGYVLQPGETFVRPHTKKVFRKDDTNV